MMKPETPYLSGQLIEGTAAEIAEVRELAREELARRHFVKFLEYVRILEPPPGRGVIPFELWPHLREVCRELEGKRPLVWAKARQIGASWLLAAYALWTGQYQEGARVLMFSQGEEEAKGLLEKSRLIHGWLPKRLQIKLGRDTQQELEFPEKMSYIKALPSTEKAGRGETATLAIFDEAERHEYLETAYNSVKPTLDDVGGRLILVSTVSATTQVSLFKTLYQGAPENGFKRLFYGWNVRGNRDRAWLEQRRAESTDKGLFEKEYPETEEQAFAPPRSIAAFDHDRLGSMKDDVKLPVERPWCGSVQGSVYQGFHPGKRYAAATDTSHGVGGDDAVTVILDVTTGYVVADIQTNLLPPDQLAAASIKLLEQYGKPVWGIEDNEWGAVTLSAAQAMRYPSLYFRDEGRPGWHTDEHSRYILWGELIEAVYSRLVTVPSKEGLAQFYSVIRNPEKHGRIEAQRGAHDDYPLAVGIAWQLRRYARAAGQAPREFSRGYQVVGPGRRKGRSFVRW